MLGKKFKHVAPILLAKTTHIYALVSNFKICSIWLENGCPQTFAVLVYSYFSDGLR